MNSDITTVISDIFTHYGALVEKTDDECLQYICPRTLSKALEIPEEGSLVFKYDHACDDAVLASYDSDLFRHLENLFADRGRLAGALFKPPHSFYVEKIEKDIYDKIAFSNATFRMDSTDTATMVYVLVFFKYTALSDEKQEGLIALLINKTNLSVIPVYDEAYFLFTELDELPHSPMSLDEETIRAISASFSVASLLVKENIADYIKSLNRRLNRDIKRVHEYYETLKKETRYVIKNKALSLDKYAHMIIEEPQAAGDVIEQGIKERTIKGEGIEKLYDKLDAIDTEEKWKEQDLRDKCTLKIQVEPITTLYIETYAPIFWVTLKRRLNSRLFPVTYNPILKRLDPLPCESCFYPQSPYFICDDTLHIVCSRCFITCQECGKTYCKACHKEKCPKCGRTH
jgi:hypothetical protein